MSYTFIVKFEINAVPEGKVLLGSVSDNAMGCLVASRGGNGPTRLLIFLAQNCIRLESGT